MSPPPVEQGNVISKLRLPRSGRRKGTAGATYWTTSKRPLQILVFLLPLVLAYELALPWLIASQGRDVEAHRRILQFFEGLGVTTGALYLGGVVVVVVLLIWHLLNRDPWRIDSATAGMMAIEALVLTLPLIVLGQLIVQTELAGPLLSATAQGAQGADYASWSVWEKLTISVGAGLYEELLFRMLLIAVIHTLLVDAGGVSHTLGAAIAVGVSASAFTWYHPPQEMASGRTIQELSFYFLAGLYFGAIYVQRGFGIVVAVHALYDILTLSLLADPAGG